jgi:hypothetical protein
MRTRFIFKINRAQSTSTSRCAPVTYSWWPTFQLHSLPVCDRSPAKIVGLNLTQGTDVCCLLSGRGLCSKWWWINIMMSRSLVKWDIRNLENHNFVDYSCLYEGVFGQQINKKCNLLVCDINHNIIRPPILGVRIPFGTQISNLTFWKILREGDIYLKK